MPKKDLPLYKQIVERYKISILNQELDAYHKLPSIRSYAKKHGISKTTIEKAYHQLQIEGYITSQPKSGYYVLPLSKTAPVQHHKPYHGTKRSPYINLSQQKDTIDLTPLKRAYANVFSDDPDALYDPASPSGEQTLKETLHQHITEERGVIATAEQMIISSGIQNHLLTIASFINDRTVTYVAPLFNRADQLFNLTGFKRLPCESFEDMLNTDASFYYISPSNQYPSGDVVSINDRLRLIAHAEKNNAWIIEDDYNHIFRYNAYQIPSIQGLDKGRRVIYIGSLSRNLLISTRISYMVLPNQLLERYHTSEKLAQTVSVIDQLAIAEYMRSGQFQKHLKKLSAHSKKQNEFLTELIDTIEIRPDIHLSGLDSNLHLLIHCANSTTFESIKQQAEQLNIYIDAFLDKDPTILLPYSGLTANQLTHILKTLLQ